MEPLGAEQGNIKLELTFAMTSKFQQLTLPAETYVLEENKIVFRSPFTVYLSSLPLFKEKRLPAKITTPILIEKATKRYSFDILVSFPQEIEETTAYVSLSREEERIDISFIVNPLTSALLKSALASGEDFYYPCRTSRDMELYYSASELLNLENFARVEIVFDEDESALLRGAIKYLSELSFPPKVESYPILAPLEERTRLVKEIFSDPSKYRLGRLLGQGAFGKVYLAETLTEPVELYAVKLIPVSSVTRKGKILSLKREALLTKDLELQYSVMTYGLFEINHLRGDNYALVQDYFQGENLLSLDRESEKLLLEVMLKAAYALQELQEKGKIVHLDIKPANILYNEESKVLKLIDFGGACRFDDSEAARLGPCITNPRGTPNFMSPEIINKNFSYLSEADIWSLGATFYYLAYYEPVIFYPKSEEKSLLRLVETVNRYTKPDFPPDFPHLEKVLARCLTKSPEERIKLKELIMLLREEIKKTPD